MYAGVADFPRKNKSITVSEYVSFDAFDLFVAVLTVISLSAAPSDALRVNSGH